jgi:hypothetical protein
MQHARRASLVAALLLLVSVGTAFAECAWVVWGQTNDDRYRPIGDALKSQEDCQHRANMLANRPSLPSMRTDLLSRHACLSSALSSFSPSWTMTAGSAGAARVPSQDSTIHLFAHAGA